MDSPSVSVSSPSKRSSVRYIKDLVRVQKLPEAVEQLSAFQATTLWVNEHQQGAHVIPKLAVLRKDNASTESCLWGTMGNNEETQLNQAIKMMFCLWFVSFQFYTRTKQSDLGRLPQLPWSPGWPASWVACCWWSCLWPTWRFSLLPQNTTPAAQQHLHTQIIHKKKCLHDWINQY